MENFEIRKIPGGYVHQGFSKIPLIVDEVSQLYCEIWKEPPWGEDFWLPERVAKDLLREVTKRGGILLYAELLIENGVVGFTWGYEVTPDELFVISGNKPEWQKVVGNKKTFYVDELGVKSTFRGKGVAEKLTRELLEVLEKRGVGFVVLRTDIEATPAMNLYRKLGFRETNIVDEIHPTRVYWVKKI